jgi:hypothetical protein
VVGSTGLDSTTAFEILLAMRVWATGTGGTVLATLLQVGPVPGWRTGVQPGSATTCVVLERRGAAVFLLQPIPEVYNLFDQILLLQDSHLVYSGPREGACWTPRAVVVCCCW